VSGLVAVSRQAEVLRVALDRPDVRNALSSELAAELGAAFGAVAREPGVRVVILEGRGRDFCAGADLRDMKRMGEAAPEENRADAMRLAAAFRAIWSCPRPVVARVTGNVLGGGIGLVAACDVAIVSTDATFAFREVRLGILPAVISPYVVRRIGAGAARRLFLTGESFGAEEAVALGLCARSVDPDDLDAVVGRTVDELLQGSPDAQSRIKRLLDAVSGASLDEAAALAAGFIADARASDEGREGLRAFLEKRRPAWAKTSGGGKP
jgi:methylglutaconyl-CoA hydratase